MKKWILLSFKILLSVQGNKGVLDWSHTHKIGTLHIFFFLFVCNNKTTTLILTSNSSISGSIGQEIVTEDDLGDLLEYKNKNRVIVTFTQSENDLQLQALEGQIEAKQCEYDNRFYH